MFWQWVPGYGRVCKYDWSVIGVNPSCSTFLGIAARNRAAWERTWLRTENKSAVIGVYRRGSGRSDAWERPRLINMKTSNTARSSLIDRRRHNNGNTRRVTLDDVSSRDKGSITWHARVGLIKGRVVVGFFSVRLVRRRSRVSLRQPRVFPFGGFLLPLSLRYCLQKPAVSVIM